MDIKIKQMIEKNKKAKGTALGILIFGFILCALGFANGIQITAFTIFRIAVFPIATTAMLILYKTNKESEKFRIIAFAALALAYMAVVMFTQNPYMYAYVYLLMIFAAIYMDKKFTILTLGVCDALIVMSTARFIIAKIGNNNENVIQAVFAIFASVMLYNIVVLNSNHSQETMDAIVENAEKEAAVAKEIFNLSENLASKFEIAKENASVMTDNLTASSEAVSEISDSIKVTAESIEQQTRLTADIQTSLEETAKATQEMKEASDASASAVETGKKAMEILAKQAELTGELNKRSQETTDELGNRIHEVESITGEILTISSQTNLLALNASIEAARAGEAGRGFAVVADEIRQLSEQTKNSVNKITTITNRLVENSQEASANMSQSITASEKQNEMVDDAIREISKIAEKNEILTRLMNTISSQIEGIVNANTQINDSISNLSAMSEQVAASSESSAQVMNESMNSMNSLNELLAEIYSISQEMASITK